MQNPQNRNTNSAKTGRNSLSKRASVDAESRNYVDGQELSSRRYFENHERALDGSDDEDSQTPIARRSLSPGRGGYGYATGDRYDENEIQNYGENTRDNYGSLPQDNNLFGSGFNYGSTYSTGTDYGSERFGKRWREDDREVRATHESRLSHSGTRPKNYQRTDARIEEDVNEALTVHHEIDASDLEVSVDNGVVTLSGTVPAREMKHSAEDLVVGLPGVKDVKNQITSSRFLARIFHR